MTTTQLSIKYDLNRAWIATQMRKGYIKNAYKDSKGHWRCSEEDFKHFLKYYTVGQYTFRVGWDRRIFDVITPEVAYWLGFIVADGCIQAEQQERGLSGHFSIDVGEQDKEHLDKFSLFIGAQQPVLQKTVHSQTGNNLYHIQLCSSYALERLVSLGLQPRKSGKEKFIETPFPRDFIRGVIDGDGYIRKDLTEIGLVGSKELLQAVQKYFLEVLGVTPNKIQTHGVIYKISYRAKQDIIAIAGHLYQESDTYFLNRKYHLAKKIEKLS